MKEYKEIRVYSDKTDKEIRVILKNHRTHIQCYEEGTQTLLFMSSEEADELAHKIYQQIQELDDGGEKK